MNNPFLRVAYILTSVVSVFCLASCGGMDEAAKPLGAREAIQGFIVFDSKTLLGHDSDDTHILRYDQDGAIKVLAVGKEPAISPDASKIAFISGHLGDTGGVAIMDANGDNETVLVDSVSADTSHPTWSPDGTKIAYSTAGRIVIIDLHRTFGQVLTLGVRPESAVSWSPDGTQFLYERMSGGKADIYRVNVDGTGDRPVRETPDVFETKPEWSPDELSIVYQVGNEVVHTAQIWAMNADGSSPHPLLLSSEQSSPTWSPQGTKIAYVRNNGNLWVKSATDGSSGIQLTFLERGDGEDVGMNNPDWSPGFFAANLSLSPANPTVTAGSPGNISVNVASRDGSAGSVNLTVTAPPTGVQVVGPLPENVPVTPGTPGQSAISVVADSSLAGTSFPLTVTATLGTWRSTATVTVDVVQPPSADFTLTVSPSSVETRVGDLRQFTVTVTPVNGLRGDVRLGYSPTAPTGLIQRFSPFSFVMNVTNGAATSTFSFENQSLTTPQTIPFTVSATRAGLPTKTATVNVVIPP